MSQLDDVISAAVETKLASTRAQLSELRDALDAWERADLVRVERDVQRAVLAAVGVNGQSTPASDEAGPALARLRAAVAWLVPAAPPLRKESLPEERERAATLLAEIQATDIEREPVNRRQPLLQAWVAELRLLMQPLSPESALRHELHDSLSRLSSLKKRAGIGFVEGMSLGNSADFEGIAFRARSALARIDAPKPPAPPTLHAPLALVARKSR